MQHSDGMQKLTRTAFIATIALVIITATVWGIRLFAMSRNQTVTQSTNPANYPIGGFPMTGNLAPDFKLTDQFGHSVILSSLRGHEIVLARAGAWFGLCLWHGSPFVPYCTPLGPL